VWNDAFVVHVRPLLTGDLDACLDIVRGLPEFFTAGAMEAIRHDLGRRRGWAAEEGAVVGFAVVERRSRATAEILWAAVRRDRRGLGIGTRLIEHVLGALAEDGVVLVEVKTLDRSAGYDPYEPTRAFWEGRGFLQIDRIDPLPGWQPGNPCAIYVAALGTTRPG